MTSCDPSFFLPFIYASFLDPRNINGGTPSSTVLTPISVSMWIRRVEAKE